MSEPIKMKSFAQYEPVDGPPPSEPTPPPALPSRPPRQPERPRSDSDTEEATYAPETGMILGNDYDAPLGSIPAGMKGPIVALAREQGAPEGPWVPLGVKVEPRVKLALSDHVNALQRTGYKTVTRESVTNDALIKYLGIPKRKTR